MRAIATALGLVLLLFARTAAADPWFDADQNELEERAADGDLDEEDHVAASLVHRSAAAEVHGQSWVSLAGYSRVLATGKNDLGAIVVVGLALDRLAAGPVHRLADPPAQPAPPPPPAPSASLPAASTPGEPGDLRPGLARDCVVAAWRASGLGTDDARLDAIEARSRSSALLPETRVRAMRLWTDASHTTTLATTDGTNYYDAIGANLVLEVRLTWRLDRVVYAGDEPTLERVRLERSDARNKLADRILQSLFAWARARAAARDAAPASREEGEARLRAAEAAATLDVLTGGWFAAQRAAAEGVKAE